MIGTPRAVQYGGKRVTRGAFLPQLLDRVQDPQPISHTGDSHLLQGRLVQLEENIASNVICFERSGLVSAFDVGKP